MVSFGGSWCPCGFGNFKVPSASLGFSYVWWILVARAGARRFDDPS